VNASDPSPRNAARKAVPPQPPQQSKEAGEGGSFDERLARLQAIVSELEQGELGLEPAIERYQEGIELLKQCHTVLAGYRRRVEELSAEAEAGIKAYGADPDFPKPGEAGGRGS
jgi:exodeoxyribonuclease VII small subunit